MRRNAARPANEDEIERHGGPASGECEVDMSRQSEDAPAADPEKTTTTQNPVLSLYGKNFTEEQLLKFFSSTKSGINFASPIIPALFVLIIAATHLIVLMQTIYDDRDEVINPFAAQLIITACTLLLSILQPALSMSYAYCKQKQEEISALQQSNTLGELDKFVENIYTGIISEYLDVGYTSEEMHTLHKQIEKIKGGQKISWISPRNSLLWTISTLPIFTSTGGTISAFIEKPPYIWSQVLNSSSAILNVIISIARNLSTMYSAHNTRMLNTQLSESLSCIEQNALTCLHALLAAYGQDTEWQRFFSKTQENMQQQYKHVPKNIIESLFQLRQLIEQACEKIFANARISQEKAQLLGTTLCDLIDNYANIAQSVRQPEVAMPAEEQVLLLAQPNDAGPLTTAHLDALKLKIQKDPVKFELTPAEKQAMTDIQQQVDTRLGGFEAKLEVQEETIEGQNRTIEGQNRTIEALRIEAVKVPGLETQIAEQGETIRTLQADAARVPGLETQAAEQATAIEILQAQMKSFQSWKDSAPQFQQKKASASEGSPESEQQHRKKGPGFL